MKGNWGFLLSNIGANKCPSRWWIGIDFIPRAQARDSATLLPTNKAPDKPGPEVYAIASISLISLEANSGTTPP